MNYFHQNVNYMSTKCSLKMGRCHLPTADYNMHWHTGIEIIYGGKSNYTVTAGNTVYDMSDGDIIFIPSRILHSFSMVNQPDPLFFIIFKAEPMFTGGDIYLGKYDSQTFNPLIRNTTIIRKSEYPDIYPHIETAVKSLIDIMQSYTDGFRYLAVSKLYEIIGLMYKYKLAGSSIDDTVTDEQITSITKAFVYLENHFNEEISINDIAEHCGFSTKYFGRLFKKVTGSFFNEFLTDFRIKKATDMLRTGGTPIVDIPFACGFSATSTFYRAFKKKYGCSPKQFIDRYNN